MEAAGLANRERCPPPTIVRASTASTSDARNAAEIAGATTVHDIIVQTLGSAAIRM
jgi:hypothetical protein